MTSKRETLMVEMGKLAALDAPTQSQYDRFTDLERQLIDLDNEEREQARDRLRAAINGGGRIESGSPGETATQAYSSAQRAIDSSVRAGHMADHGAEAAVRLIEHGSARDRRAASQWASVTADPDYLTAFGKLCADPERGHLAWSESERVAFANVQEYRAASLTDVDGGYLVPASLDPAILIDNGGSISPLRAISRVETIASDQWVGVSSEGVSASWRAEAAEVGDDTPELAQPVVPVHRGDAFVPFSVEVGMDAPAFVSEMTKLLVDASLQLENTAFTVGTGTGQPTGVVTALAGGPSVVSAAGEAITAADVLAVQNALPPRWQGRAQWVAGLPTLNALGELETANGAARFPELGSGQLLRKPISELSTLDSTINPAATQNNYVMIYGDFSNLLIVDRIGTSVELIPHLFGPQRRPTLQRGLLMWRRTGSDVLVDDAFRVLDVNTTA